jgi:acyl-coenzyme A thioesterase PaaI-like protein
MSAATALPDAASTVRDLANPPAGEERLKLFIPCTEEAAAIDKLILEHPLTKSLIEDKKYIASRPHLMIPLALRNQNLTAGTLLGPNKLAVPPLQFTTADGSTFVSLQYLGTALCGHPGIIHGGLLATLLDEGTGLCCMPALPNKVAVTASLKLDYKKPVMAGQVVVLKAETTKVEGRKAWVKGWLETLVEESKGEKPLVLCEAEALFIEPKRATNLWRAEI